jgi:predicted DNA-binding transcriptional regulator YafY
MRRVQRFGRLLSILSEVIQHPGQRPAQLATRLGISERTLFRDLGELQKMGVGLNYSDGYQMQERLNLEGIRVTGEGASLPVVYEQQLRLLRSEFPADVAREVQAEVERAAPLALAQLFQQALDSRTAAARNGS